MLVIIVVMLVIIVVMLVIIVVMLIIIVVMMVKTMMFCYLTFTIQYQICPLPVRCTLRAMSGGVADSALCCSTARYLYYGCKTRQLGLDPVERADFVDKMKEGNHHSCRLRLFEACLESGPQLIFQLYVLLVTKPQMQGLDGTHLSS